MNDKKIDKNTKKGILDPLPKSSNLPPNSNVTTLFCDIVNLQLRKDGIALLSFFSKVPGINLEQSRLAISHHLLRSLIDISCKGLDYYPTNPQKIAKKEK